MLLAVKLSQRTSVFLTMEYSRNAPSPKCMLSLRGLLSPLPDRAVMVSCATNPCSSLCLMQVGARHHGLWGTGTMSPPGWLLPLVAGGGQRGQGHGPIFHGSCWLWRAEKGNWGKGEKRQFKHMFYGHVLKLLYSSHPHCPQRQVTAPAEALPYHKQYPFHVLHVLLCNLLRRIGACAKARLWKSGASSWGNPAEPPAGPSAAAGAATCPRCDSVPPTPMPAIQSGSPWGAFLPLGDRCR